MIIDNTNTTLFQVNSNKALATDDNRPLKNERRRTTYIRLWHYKQDINDQSYR